MRVTVKELIVPVRPETGMADGYVDAGAWVAERPRVLGSTSPIDPGLENVVEAEAGEVSQTIGADNMVSDTQIDKTRDFLDRNIPSLSHLRAPLKALLRKSVGHRL